MRNRRHKYSDGRTLSANGEEVYYSDSTYDLPDLSRPTALQNGSNRTQVHEARNMVIKTQKTNIHKINSILESNFNKVQTCKVNRRAKYIIDHHPTRAEFDLKKMLRKIE